MLRPATIAAGALALLGARGGAPAAADPPRSAVESRLSGYERVFTGADLVALGPGADRVLAQIAGDRAAPPLLRARAVSALGYARTPASRAFLEDLLKTKGQAAEAVDRLMLRKAAVALGWQGLPDAVPLISPLLRHSDEDVRMDAAVALGLTRTSAALEPLRARLGDEPAAAVKHQIARQVKTLEAALPPAAAPKKP